MIRSAILIVFFFAVPIGADRALAQTGGFDPQLASNVYTTALTFITPRIVDAEPVSRLTVWGLQGITAIDPGLTVAARDGRLRLTAKDKTIFETAAPKDDAMAEWVSAAIALTKAAADTSPKVRREGTGPIVQAFFDEMFTHVDPYSRYVPPGEAADDREQRTGRAGIGVTLAQRGPAVSVSDVVRGSPAAAAGIRPGDTIVAIGGEPVRGLGASVVSSMIFGPENTDFHLTWRGRDGKSRESDFSRVLVPPETVFSQRSDDLLIVRVAGFNNATDVHLAQLLQDGMAGNDPPDGIVLDLRGNRGGLLRQAVTVADMFLPEGLIVSTTGRAPDAGHTWLSTAGQLAEGVPLVVLVDGHTASAAEVLAAALADRGRAVVVGSTTFGKGLVQTITPLPDGGELFVTWSRLLAPRGWPIQGLGVMPQVCTSLGGVATQQQMDALGAGNQSTLAAVNANRAARAPVPAARVQEIRNTCPPSEGREDDLAVARDLIANPAAYAAALLPPLR